MHDNLNPLAIALSEFYITLISNGMPADTAEHLTEVLLMQFMAQIKKGDALNDSHV